MDSNIIPLPRPRQFRTGTDQLAFFIRVGRNDHRELLDLIATGERSIFGFVIEAQYVEQHRELVAEARRRDFDLILDPKTQPMGFPGGNSAHLAALPWGLDRHHNLSDFEGTDGRARASQIVEMARTNGFTQILGPTHLLRGPDDPWLRRDINAMGWTRDSIDASGSDLGLVYSLAVPMDVLRKRAERQALIGAIADAPCDTIWLKIDNFGDDATGEKTAAYIEACRDFHERGVPVVGDHVGGLPGVGALAFGAVGGISHGVTMRQAFKSAGWRRPSLPGRGGLTWRVYLPNLDLFLKQSTARELFEISPRIRGTHGCRDTHCCPHGVRDMIDRPARHALYQRAREVEWLSNTPQTIRATRYLDERVRPVSDHVAAIASVSGLDEALRNRLVKKQIALSRFRQAMAHLADTVLLGSIAIPPVRRITRGGHIG